MLLTTGELRRCRLRTADRQSARIHDFYFDDQTWALRYLVADLGSWLKPRRLLVEPAELGPPEPGLRSLPVALTRTELENCANAETRKPASVRERRRYRALFTWPMPPEAAPWTAATPGYVLSAVLESVPEEQGDEHLRSANEVRSYHVRSFDGGIGRVDDFVIDDQGWRLVFLVVATRNWWPGRKVIVPMEWIHSIHWSTARVYGAVPQARIRDAPGLEIIRG